MPYSHTINHNYDSNITVLPSFFVWLVLSFLVTYSIKAQAQNQIEIQFDKVEMREEFSAQNENWPNLTTMENLYVPDKGEYFMHRRHKTNPYAILSDWRNNLAVFNILTALKLGPSEDIEQTAGVIFLVQDDSKGAIVFEFNKFKQYRIKQLVGAYYKFLTGDNESQGWEKSAALANKNDYNEIDIRVDLPQVDIHLNGKFLKSFDVLDYKPGGMGFLIGADTKAKADYFYVYTTEEAKAEAELDAKETEDTKSAVVQLSKVRYELEQQKRSLKECELERAKAVSVLEEELAGLRQSNDRLAMQNRQLHEFKNQVLVEVDEDVFLTLAENLKTEIIKNQKLESQVNVYKDSLKLTHIKYSKLKLALLDKAISKAEKEKVQREKNEVIETRQEIEAELQDKKLTAEQEAWEAKNPNAKPAAVAPETVAVPEQKKAVEPISSPEVSKEQSEARPLPVKVRKAQKRED